MERKDPQEFADKYKLDLSNSGQFKWVTLKVIVILKYILLFGKSYERKTTRMDVCYWQTNS
jgi:hypothetical protein